MEKKISREFNTFTIVAILVIAFFSSLPEFVPGIHYGHDLMVHLNRIEGIAEGLRDGQFPVRITGSFLGGYGYSIPIYYCDLFLYVPALLYLGGMAIGTAYKLYIFFINLFTAVSSYKCFKGIYDNKNTGLICALVYTTATYRLVDIYTRAAVGEYSAMLFIPIVVLAVVNICREKNSIFGNALTLGLGMAGIFMTHMLSVIMVGFFMVIFILIYAKRFFTKKSLKTIGLAIGIFALVSAWFLIPFVEFCLTEKVNMNAYVAGGYNDSIQERGAFIAQYFTIRGNWLGSGTLADVKYRFTMTPGPALIGAFILGTIGIIKKPKKRMVTVYALSLLSLFLASNLFPWDALAKVKFLSWTTSIQFPWRYLEMATLLLSILLAETVSSFEDHRDGIYSLMAILAVGYVFLFNGAYCDEANTRIFKASGDLNSQTIGGAEYLPMYTMRDYLDGEVILGDGVTCINYTKSENICEFFVHNGTEASYIEIPKLYYKGYFCKDADGEVLQVSKGYNNLVHIDFEGGYEGRIRVYYKEPVYWRISEVVSLISIVGLIIFSVGEKRKKNA